MTIDTTSPRTRRALLGAGLGAIAATIASAIGRPAATDAASNPVLLNQNNPATDNTKISTTSATAFWADSRSSRGVYGSSNTYIGVYGSSNSHVGVWGSSGSSEGVVGYSATGNGVGGSSSASAASGVYGENKHQGYGVAGRSNSPPLGTSGVFAAATLGDNTANGVGVWGRSGHGIGVVADGANADAVAFEANGVTRFARSGRLTIAVGTSSVSPLFSVRVDPGTLVLATLQQNRAGYWIQSAVPDHVGDSFTITLSRVVSGLVPIKVA